MAEIVKTIPPRQIPSHTADDSWRSRRRAIRAAILQAAKRQFAAREDLSLVAPISPTPAEVIWSVFTKMDTVPSDAVFIDLGCGDGRWLVAAAKRFGCKCVGYELDASRLALCRAAAQEEGVADRLELHDADIFAADLAAATVIVLYLFGNALEPMRDKILAEAPADCLVLSVGFAVPGLAASWIHRQPGAPPVFAYQELEASQNGAIATSVAAEGPH